MHITIDGHSGFCSGVINAIRTAEEWLQKEGTLYCLGDIGLKVITYDEFRQLHGVRVLIRAHGEPPETYRIAQENGIEIIDATCKVVLNLQKTIKQEFESDRKDSQILIFGKQGHAEVIGLLGQTNGKGLVISSLEDIRRIDLSRPAVLFSQDCGGHHRGLPPARSSRTLHPPRHHLSQCEQPCPPVGGICPSARPNPLHVGRQEFQRALSL